MRFSHSFIPGLVLITCATAAGQTSTASTQPKNSGKAAAANAEAERLLRERRAGAQSLLENLAADARNFNDPTLRARTQARVADALWEVDRERSRTMFRSAWDSAEMADAESQARLKEDIRQQQAKTGSGGYVAASPPDLRREVLRLAARRDRTLGEEFLAKFKAQKASEAADATKRQANPLGTDAATSQRLGLARQLLDSGDIERALEFADPVLTIATMASIDFLSYLRDKAPAEADRRYASILAAAPLDQQSDANTVSLLSAYLFTPHLYVSFSGNGVSSSKQTRDTPAPTVAPQLRDAFFRTAAAILLRPLPPAGQENSTGVDGQYLVIKRLLPLFEAFAPAETTAALKAQMEALSALASNNARDRDDEWLNKGIGPAKPAVNREQSLLDRFDRAKTSTERDQLSLQLALLYADKGDLKARDYIGKIDDTELRNSARGYIDANMAMRAIEKKDAEQVVELVRTGELTHLQKSWALAQAAKLLAKTNRERALSLTEDAAAEARRIENSDADRPRAFIGVANALYALDPKAAWNMMDDAMRAANSAEDFTGEDGQVTFRLISAGMRSINQSTVADFDVAGLFEAFAREDYERAVELARGFQHNAPRASATIAIARTVLDEKKN